MERNDILILLEIFLLAIFLLFDVLEILVFSWANLFDSITDSFVKH